MGYSTWARFVNAEDLTLLRRSRTLCLPPEVDARRGVPACWVHLDLAVRTVRNRERRRDSCLWFLGVSHSTRQSLCLSGQHPLRVLPRLKHSRSQERGFSYRPLLLVVDSGEGSHFLEVRSLGYTCSWHRLSLTLCEGRTTRFSCSARCPIWSSHS